jgi:hypothetical protein
MDFRNFKSFCQIKSKIRQIITTILFVTMNYLKKYATTLVIILFYGKKKVENGLITLEYIKLSIYTI